MIVGYKIQCRGLKEPTAVKGDSYDECMQKFIDYWSCDYDIHTDEIISVNAIDLKFDLE